VSPLCLLDCPGGVAPALSLFEMSVDMLRSLCLGSVGNGLKFCTLGESQCSFSTHSKKVHMAQDTLYIAAGRNSAFTHHSMPTRTLSRTQINQILQERHTKEEWALLFHSWKQNSQINALEEPSSQFPGLIGMQSAIKPAKRFHSDILDVSGGSMEREGLAATSLDSEFDLVDIPVEDFRDTPQEEAFARILFHWEALISNVSKFNGLLHQVKSSFGYNLNIMDNQIKSVEARLGSCSKPTLSNICITAWDGIIYLDDYVESVANSLKVLEDQQASLRTDAQDSWTTLSSRLDDVVLDVCKSAK
jgi:hypothetical protein